MDGIIKPAKEIGYLQYTLISSELLTLSKEDRLLKLQQYWNEFKAILNVSSIRADIIFSKYMPLLFAYQELFNFKGGEIPKLDGLNTNSDTSNIEKEIIDYLNNLPKQKKSKPIIKKPITEIKIQKDYMDLLA